MNGRPLLAVALWFTATAVGTLDAPPFDSPLPGAPFAGALGVNGGFCEYRVGHFHAGFDLSTNGVVGRPVLAPADGWVERVRSSGVGYGRSIYLHTRDGRLLQFGHLDAYAPALAVWVRAAQESTGQYEQDFWPPAGRFAFRTGDVLAWSGESGAGGPHLHFEIRRGDMAYHPQRAGLTVEDHSPPTLVSLTLEPMDDTSRVEGRLGPVTRALGTRADTLRVRGRMRAIVGARDGVWRGVDRMVPWSVAMEWQGRRTECRFDSVSWATDMVESDFVYDSGRTLGDEGLLLWAPAGFRPRVLVADAPRDEEAGAIVVRPGDPPRTLGLTARDLGGGLAERRVVLIAAEARPAGPAVAPDPGPRVEGRLAFASFPGGFVRVTARGLPRAGTKAVFGWAREGAGPEWVAGLREGDDWVAMLRFPGSAGAGPDSLVLSVRGEGTSGAWTFERPVRVARVRPEAPVALDAARSDAGCVFEDAVLLAMESASPTAEAELVPASAAWTLAPDGLPLRSALRISLPLRPGSGSARAALYRRDGGDWSWLGDTFDARAHTIAGDSRRLGTFAVFRDTVPPRATLLRPAPAGARAPYSRWALEASVRESGSGVAARGSWLEVDGRRVPTEWDPEQGVLRWRPAAPPGAGAHRARVIVADRAGNTSRTAGSFVRR